MTVGKPEQQPDPSHERWKTVGKIAAGLGAAAIIGYGAYNIYEDERRVLGSPAERFSALFDRASLDRPSKRRADPYDDLQMESLADYASLGKKIKQ